MKTYITTHNTPEALGLAIDYITEIAHDFDEGDHPKVRGLLARLENARDRLKPLDTTDKVILASALKHTENDGVEYLDDCDEEEDFSAVAEYLAAVADLAHRLGLNHPRILKLARIRPFHHSSEFSCGTQEN